MKKSFTPRSWQKNFPGRYDLKFPWFWAVFSGLAVLCLSFFILQDRAIKLNALKNGEYRTYQGHIAQIARVDKGRNAWTKSRINFKISGYATDSDGRHHKLNRYNDRVTTKGAIIADWGNNCSGYKCGLSIGDNSNYGFLPFMGL